MSDRAIPRQSSVWNDRRNTSRVFPVPPGAVEDAERALQRWQAENPAHARWILDGYPTLTDDEHVSRFGVPYEPAKRRRGRA
jgi:hypothetical protein